MELRAGFSLASLFGLRMLGLFLVLPVFAVHAPRLAGGDNLTLVGIALGAYGLSQSFLQLPFGMASGWTDVGPTGPPERKPASAAVARIKQAKASVG